MRAGMPLLPVIVGSGRDETDASAQEQITVSAPASKTLQSGLGAVLGGRPPRPKKNPQAPAPSMPPRGGNGGLPRQAAQPGRARPPLQRRHTIHPNLDPAKKVKEEDPYVNLGHFLPAETVNNLAGIVRQQAEFMSNPNAQRFAYAMQRSGLMTYKTAAKLLRTTPHVLQVLWISLNDPGLRNIALLGLQLREKFAKSTGVTAKDFRPLFTFFREFGINRRGVVVDPGKFEARTRRAEERMRIRAELMQAHGELTPRLGGTPFPPDELSAVAALIGQIAAQSREDDPAEKEMAGKP